jgi:transposase
MRHFEFSQDVLAEIERDRFRHPDPLVQQRMEVLWVKAHGEVHVRIAELAGLARATVQRILDQYEAGGLESVRTFHWHVPTSELAPHQQLLEAEFRQRPPHTVAEACQRIEQLTGVRRGPTRVREFLRETMGLRWRKVAAVPVPPKQTLPEHAATQAAFLKDGA